VSLQPLHLDAGKGRPASSKTLREYYNAIKTVNQRR
jgi:hypothetical protein